MSFVCTNDDCDQLDVVKDSGGFTEEDGTPVCGVCHYPTDWTDDPPELADPPDGGL